jgi:hypothetical protein
MELEVEDEEGDRGWPLNRVGMAPLHVAGTFVGNKNRTPFL